ncbi:protein of unknown function [Methylophilus rhizosphaerae]|uniref:TMEM205-like domain-containing protein n=1 Tax=Methylophilus rhizosphaerae TaxID=492660 RepID=A0A1G9BIA5_9PROT|nr:DUF4149 domain-containing protein [Methylophilus rhizosphaerae]SDK39177.1 protein of unknown function [Methylophilus rhizosphaerae]
MARKTGLTGWLTPVVLTLWVGALWMTAITASVLFQTIADRQLAGLVAGKLFTIVSYIGMASGLWLLLQRLAGEGFSALKQGLFWVIFVMWVLVLVGEFGIQPLLAQLKASALPNDVMQSVFASRFRTWHGVASIAYMVECLLGLWLVIKSS